MAGEWTKIIGEHGENVVSNFLKFVGYLPEDNVTIGCINPEGHKLKKDNKRTQHGIDSLTAYKCPLQKDLLEILIVSSKYTEVGYKGDAKNEFKKFFKELAFTIECFKNSQKRNEYVNLHGSGVENCNNTGVLFYLSNKTDDLYTDIISKISDSTLPDDLMYENIFLMDNNKMSFIFEAIQFAKSISLSYDFIYHDTGLNVNPSESQNTGKSLPVQYFNSPVLPLRIQKENNEVFLYLALNDNFNEGNLKRMVGLAQKLNNLSNSTIIAFPDFSKLQHSQTAQMILSSFKDKTFSSKVSIESFRPNFTNQI